MNPPPSPTFWAKILKKKTSTLPSKILNSPFGFKKYFVRANFFFAPSHFQIGSYGPESIHLPSIFLRLVSWVVHWLTIRVVHLLPISTSRRENLGTRSEYSREQGGWGGGEGALKGNLGRPAVTLFETKIVQFTTLFKSGCTSFHDHDFKKNTLRKSRKIT